MANQKVSRARLIDESRLNRIINLLPSNWKEQGLEPVRGEYTPMSNVSVKAIAAVVYTMQLVYATRKSLESIFIEQCIQFGLTLNKRGDECRTFERARELLMDGTNTEILNAFTPGSGFSVFKHHENKTINRKVKQETNTKNEKLRTGAVLRERQLALEFVDLVSVEALGRAYKFAASEFSTDRPGHGDAQKSSRLNVLWGELKALKK